MSVFQMNESLAVQLNRALDVIDEMRLQRQADEALIAKLRAALRAADDLAEWHAGGVR